MEWTKLIVILRCVDFSGPIDYPWQCQWFGCDLGTDTLKVVPAGRCRDTSQGWWESFLWKWSSSIRRAGGVINLGAEWSSLGWAMHRLLCEVRQPPCPGSLSAFGAGIAVLFQGTGLLTGLLAALGMWFLWSEMPSCTQENVPDKLSVTNFLPKALVSSNWHFLLKNILENDQQALVSHPLIWPA